MVTPIMPPASAVSLDEALLDFAEQTGANVLVDASEIPPEAQVEPYQLGEGQEQGIERSRLIRYIEAQAEVSDKRVDVDTLLFWHRPDSQTLIPLIVQFQEALDARFPPPAEASPDRLQKFSDDLMRFVAEKYGWKAGFLTVAEKEVQFEKATPFIALSEFPPELQNALHGQFYYWIKNMNGEEVSYHYFQKKTWDNARVVLGESHSSSYRLKNPNDPDSGIVESSSKPQPFISVIFPGTKLKRLGVGFPRVVEPTGFVQRKSPRVIQIAEQVKAPDDAATAVKIETERAPLTIQDAVVPISITENKLDLGAETVLEKQVTFSARRKTLGDFVIDLQKQSGVALSLAPDVAPEAQITARSQGMKLGDVMDALAQLYSATWSKNADGYVLQSKHLDALHRRMAEWGGDVYINATALDRDKYFNWSRSVADEIIALNPAGLKTEEGAPFTILPTEIQSQVMTFLRDARFGKFVQSQQRLDDVMNVDVRFRLGRLPAENMPWFFPDYSVYRNYPTPFPGNSSWAAYTSDERYITGILPQFSIMPPSEQDKQDELRSPEDQAYLRDPTRGAAK